MSESLAGKVALITGAAQGIGADTAKLLAERGAFVGLADIDAGGVERVAAGIRSAGRQASATALDVTDETAIVNVVGNMFGQHGRIDILFNCAALLGEAQRARHLDVLKLDADVWDAAMAVNARGPMLIEPDFVSFMRNLTPVEEAQ